MYTIIGNFQQNQSPYQQDLNGNFQQNQSPYQQNLNGNFQQNQTPYTPNLNGNIQQNQILYQQNLNENFQQNQLIYQQNLNENFLKNEKKKKKTICLLICGIIFFSIEMILNFFLIIGLSIGIGFSGECDYEEYEDRKRCEEDYKKDEKKLNDALVFVLPYIIISSITIFLGISYNKKLIILNYFCILIKISLYIVYSICLSEVMDDGGGYIILMILPEIISDILFFMNGILKSNIKSTIQ